MQSMDYHYIAAAVVSLFGIPVRVFQGETEVCHSFPAKLPRDPMELHKEDILDIAGHVGYYVTPMFHYYGVLNSDNIRFVIGPCSQIRPDDQQLRELAFGLNIRRDDVPRFLDGMHAIACLSVETLLQMLCALNHFMNGGETLNLADLAIREAEQEALKSGIEEKRTAKIYAEEIPVRKAHSTYAIENTIMDIVSKGDTAALRDALSQAPAIQSGTIAIDQLRQFKNVFIVTATLASRAAIRGGMREDDAFSLSDAYIQRAELLGNYESILNLQYHMLLEITEQVEKLRRGRFASRLVLDVANYVRHHLSERISVDAMAEELFLSRPYLSAKFRQDSGQTLTDFILNEKTEEAKRLLRYSDRTASVIAAYLGFSSQGHFCRVFKKYAGVTPNEYRESHKA